jgi:hypothetical protein
MKGQEGGMDARWKLDRGEAVCVFVAVCKWECECKCSVVRIECQV